MTNEKTTYVTWIYQGNNHPSARLANAVRESRINLVKLLHQNRYIDEKTRGELVCESGLSRQNKSQHPLQHCTKIHLKAINQESASRLYKKIKPHLNNNFPGIEEHLLEPLP
ncbi:MAG: hypothetical protein Q8L29_01360 [archaeon]|nr:hypothetical protein [archaeon]